MLRKHELSTRFAQKRLKNKQSALNNDMVTCINEHFSDLILVKCISVKSSITIA